MPRIAFLAVSLVVLYASGGPIALLDGRLPYTNDMTGHVWWLSAFRSAFLHGHPLGWSNDINLGYLFGYTYFPFPPLVVTALSFVLPMAAAIKIMVFGSLLSMPFGLWRLSKALGHNALVQALVVSASPLALLSCHYVTIGGTLYDTLVGEFSMAFSLGLGLWSIASLIQLIDGSGRWWWSGILIAATVLSHLQGAIGVALCTVCVLVFRARGRRSWYSIAAATVLGLGLSAWWWLPGAAVANETLGDVNPVSHNLAGYFLDAQTGPLVVVGVLGLLLGTWRRRAGATEIVSAVAVVASTVLLPLSVFSAGRVLPVVFWLAVLGWVFIVLDIVDVVQRRGRVVSITTVIVVALVALVVPLSNAYNRTAFTTVDAVTNRGIESFKGYPAIQKLTSVLAALPPGRVMVETPANFVDQEGDWLWPNLLPLSTNGHDTSPEAVFVNVNPSSIAIQYAYENLSLAYSSPVTSWQPNPAAPDPRAGVTQLRALGVNYFVVETPQLEAAFRGLPDVQLLATVNVLTTDTPAQLFSPLNTQGTYWVYGIKQAPVIVGVTNIVPMSPLAAKPYALSEVRFLQAIGRNTRAPVPAVDAAPYSGPVAHVLSASISSTAISFRVDRVGEPVIIRQSYSPLWHVTGGKLYRAEPNEMLIVPSATTVNVTFTPPTTQRIGLALTTVSGVGAVVAGLSDIRRRRSSKTTSSR
jgi:hypothetical protein